MIGVRANIVRFDCCSVIMIVGILRAIGEWTPAPSTMLRTGFTEMTNLNLYRVLLIKLEVLYKGGNE